VDVPFSWYIFLPLENEYIIAASCATVTSAIKRRASHLLTRIRIYCCYAGVRVLRLTAMAVAQTVGNWQLLVDGGSLGEGRDDYQ